MAPTITRLVLSFALMVAAPVFYTIIFVVWMDVAGHRHDDIALLVADIVVGLGFALGWLLIWLFEVRWNLHRVIMTAIVFSGSTILSLLAGVLIEFMINEEELAILFAGMLFAVFWLFGTGLSWMEMPWERRKRLAQVGMNEVLCTKCGYNMRGLTNTACPECGSTFTVDTLFAAQLEQRKKLGEG